MFLDCLLLRHLPTRYVMIGQSSSENARMNPALCIVFACETRKRCRYAESCVTGTLGGGGGISTGIRGATFSGKEAGGGKGGNLVGGRNNEKRK